MADRSAIEWTDEHASLMQRARREAAQAREDLRKVKAVAMAQLAEQMEALRRDHAGGRCS